MDTEEIVIASVEPVRVARVMGTSRGTAHAEIGPLTQRLFGQLMQQIQNQQIAMAGPAIATYQPTPDGGLAIAACCPVTLGTTDTDGFEVTELPGVAEVATYHHNGLMSGLGAAYTALERWFAESGRQTDGSAREVYLVSHPEPEERWQTELQMPIIGH